MKSRKAFPPQLQGQSANLIGWTQLHELRAAIAMVANELDVRFVFDPDSDPQLRDYLAAAVVGAAEGSLIGGAIGALFGLLIGNPGLGYALGTGAGLLVGASNGVARVDDGWRIYVGWSHDRIPFAIVHRLARRAGS